MHSPHLSRHEAVDHVVPTPVMTLLSLRRRGRARDVDAALMAPLVEYHQPQWTNPAGKSPWISSVPMRAISATSERCATDINAPLSAEHLHSALRTADVARSRMSSNHCGEVKHAAADSVDKGGTTRRSSAAAIPLKWQGDGGLDQHRRRSSQKERPSGLATSERSTSESPPPRRAPTSGRSSANRIVEVRPGCATSTERTRYRNCVTKKLMDLYDEVAELYKCSDNMVYQVTQAMRADPRYTKERHSEVQLADKLTSQQQSTVKSVEDALKVLHGAIHELVACYLTPEEKRYLGIDTHNFQTSTEKKHDYQYAPPSSSSPGTEDTAGRANRVNDSMKAGESPAPSTHHSVVSNGNARHRRREVVAAATTRSSWVGTNHNHAVHPTTSHGLAVDEFVPSPAGVTIPASTHIPPRLEPPSRPVEPPPSALSPPYSSEVYPSCTAASPVVELSPMLSPVRIAPSTQQPGDVPGATHSSVEQVFSPQTPEGGGEGDAAGVMPLPKQTVATEVAEGTPERIYAPTASVSSLGGAWPSDTIAGSPTHPSAVFPSPPTRQLVERPVHGPDGKKLNSTIQPPPPSGARWVKIPVPQPASPASAPPTTPPLHGPSSTTPVLHGNAVDARAPAAKTATTSTHAPSVRPEFKRFLVDSDSDSSKT